ncbi:hypothetical protein SAMN04489835_2911 [Mycolicibacterium rutilum]|uniref:PE family protein n=1 Tax=Mycolicibacterium rutilum TaxID=370526 RepID=A0A1H6KC50_MYCRU|nr:hypothetical protein [Mycolicibacterium rutilum]SEH69028.1 hypothetical protein SAMN04489835_2911 [Mycolicibacterium rutilum]
MKKTVRASLAIGAAAVTATALTVAAPAPARSQPSTAVSHVATPPMRLAAAVEPLAVTDLPDLLQRFFVPPSAAAAFPAPQFPPVAVGNSVGTFIENAYNAIEPWVQWGFEVAEYAVGWIPVVGWFAPQIMIFYNTGEQIARSVTFNFADWIDGQISFGQGLANVGVDTVNAFIYFANAQIAFWLPPLPPIPPIGPFVAATTEEVVEDQDASAMRTSFTEDIAEKEDVEDVEHADEEIEEESPTDGVIDTDPVAEISPTPTTGSNGTVSAQGEVRGPTSQDPDVDEATTADDADNDDATTVAPTQEPSETQTENENETAPAE